MFFKTLRDSYQSFRPFTTNEAWGLFRLAAIGEAVGWTLLIIGIVCQQLPVSWNQIPVQLAGRIHGTLFLLYIAAALVLSPSLSWSLPKTIAAGLASVPPYGSLLFELWASHYIQLDKFNELKCIVKLGLITDRQA